MGRPPCCDKVGVKKGPWTPEEDIILVSYIQEHGPGNWRAVPKNNGLLRCSKSCRLRWTNYLRPGIKRGNFTEHEEKMIIHLQKLLGNRWAAIASYLPERTDNDIKNYWNTHLKKKLKKLQGESDDCVDDEDHHHQTITKSQTVSTDHQSSRGQWERKLQTDIHKAKQALCEALATNDQKITIPNLPKDPSVVVSSQQKLPYASSAENIAKLLKKWEKNTPSKSCETSSSTSPLNNRYYNKSFITNVTVMNDQSSTTCSSSRTTTVTSGSVAGDKNDGIDLTEAFESLFGFESFDDSYSNCDQVSKSASPANMFKDEDQLEVEGDDVDEHCPLVLLEKWLSEDHASSLGKDVELDDMKLDESVDFF